MGPITGPTGPGGKSQSRCARLSARNIFHFCGPNIGGAMGLHFSIGLIIDSESETLDAMNMILDIRFIL